MMRWWNPIRYAALARENIRLTRELAASQRMADKLQQDIVRIVDDLVVAREHIANGQKGTAKAAASTWMGADNSLVPRRGPVGAQD